VREHLGFKATDEELDELFTMLDDDSSGELEIKEVSPSGGTRTVLVCAGSDAAHSVCAYARGCGCGCDSDCVCVCVCVCVRVHR
jgi:hypothetical protein